MKKIKLYILNRLVAPAIVTFSDLILSLALLLRVTISPIIIIVILFVNEKLSQKIYRAWFEYREDREARRLLKREQEKTTQAYNDSVDLLNEIQADENK